MKKIFYQFTLVVLTMALVCSCSTTSNTNISKILVSHAWELSSLNGKPTDTAMFQTATPFLRFDEGGKLSGSTGCNNFAGDYKLENEALSLNAGAMTRMACPGNGEKIVLEALSQVKNIKTNGDKLTLLDGSRELMTLVPKK